MHLMIEKEDVFIVERENIFNIIFHFKLEREKTLCYFTFHGV